jgi:hypothetical protein
LQDLAKRYEAKDQKCNELRDKLKVTKASLSSKERELDMAQRLLQKLGQEKAHLRVRVQIQLQCHTGGSDAAAVPHCSYQTRTRQAEQLPSRPAATAAQLALQQPLCSAPPACQEKHEQLQAGPRTLSGVPELAG